MANPSQQQELMCGMKGWRPKWMQRFANARYFLIIFGLLGTIQTMGFHYFTVTLTTVEKRFKVPSYATGIALSGNEISEILFSMVLSYFCGKRNRPKWIAWGGVISAFSCFILASAHAFYGPGEEAIKLTTEYMSAHEIKSAETLLNNITAHKNMKSPHKLCMAAIESDIPDEDITIAPLILIFISQFVFGIGTTLYYTLGASYLDDESSKKNTPMMMAYALAFRFLGLILTFGLVSTMMRIYIDPWSTPLIEHTDPRWLGAWWLGWLILGSALFIFSLCVGLYPAVLRRNNTTLELTEIGNGKSYYEHDVDCEEKPLRTIREADPEPDMDTFCLALKRMLTNKLLMYNAFGSIFYILGSTVFLTYYSKYLEVQFNKSSSDSDVTLISGPVTIVSMIFGILSSGYIISKYQPPAKILFLFNILVGVVYVTGQFGNLFLACETGSRFFNETGLLNLTSACNMECACTDVPYSPVCDERSGTTYFSACHAGCQSWSDSELKYFDCGCAADDFTKFPEFPLLPLTVQPMTETNRPIDINDINRYEDLSKLAMVPGTCVAGCGSIFMIYTLISCFMNLLGPAARIGNLMLNFRAVPVRDKSFALGVVVCMLSLFALIPGPIIFGYIIDSTCLIWNSNGDRLGNCQIYDQTRFRYYVNLSAMFLTSLATGFEILVWWHARHLELYRDDDEIIDDGQTNMSNKKC